MRIVTVVNEAVGSTLAQTLVIMLELGLALNRKDHLREDLIIDGIEILWRDTQDLLIGVIIL